VEYGLGLSSVTGLFTIVTTLSLGEKGSLRRQSVAVFRMGYQAVGSNACNPRCARNGLKTYLSGLVLSNLVLGVLLAILTLAIGPSGFGNVNL
jgi:hypothetical protein